jgi:hypothetical protein
MKSALGMLAVTLLAVGLVVIGTECWGDRSTLVSPPSAKVEGFVRQLATRRFDRALPYLDDTLARRLSADSLQSLTDRLERAVGEIRDVRGEQESLVGDGAVVRADVTTADQRQLSLRFPLRFSSGDWAITSIDALGGR